MGTVHLVFFKIALKMLRKIASQLAHSEIESCLLQTAVMAVFTFWIKSDAILGKANRFGKCNDESKLIEKFLLAIKIDFYWVSDVPYWKFRVCLCTCISEMTLGCAYWSRCTK